MSLNQRKSNWSPRERPLASQTLAWSHRGLRQLDSDQPQGRNLALGFLLSSLRAWPEMVHLILCSFSEKPGKSQHPACSNNKRQC